MKASGSASSLRHQGHLAVAVMVASLLCIAAPAAQADDEAAHCCKPGRTSTASLTVERIQIPDLTLTRHDGVRVRLREELDSDKPVLLNFIFTTCTTICPVMSATFARLQEDLREDASPVRLVSISIDPERDTPARLREYAEALGAGEEWHFLTATTAASVQVQKAFGAYRGSKFSHAPATFLRRPGDAFWVRLDGLRSYEELEAAYHVISAQR